MNWAADWGERAAKAICGVAFHAALGTVAGIVLGTMIAYAIYAIAGGVARGVELLPFIASSAMVAGYATPRWFSRCGPWVGILGLIALSLGAQELARGWSSTWSHQTRGDFVLSQLFCIKRGCGDSEGLYALFFGWPYLCLFTYSLSSLITLRLTRAHPAS